MGGQVSKDGRSSAGATFPLAFLRPATSAFGPTPCMDVKREMLVLPGSNNGVQCVATCSVQGWRRNMEDAHLQQHREISSDDGGDVTYVIVCDGHGGAACAEAAVELMSATLRTWPSSNVIRVDAWRDLFQSTDAKLREVGTFGAMGATCVVVAISTTHVACASVGDSVAVMSRNYGGDHLLLSGPVHHPSDDDVARIVGSGHFVANNRVDGRLAVSRALGDFDFKMADALSWDKQAVTADPHVTVTERLDEDDFVLLACHHRRAFPCELGRGRPSAAGVPGDGVVAICTVGCAGNNIAPVSRAHVAVRWWTHNHGRNG